MPLEARGRAEAKAMKMLGEVRLDELCRADPWKPGPNYNKPHVPVEGEYDGETRLQCLCCGRWLEDVI